MNTQALSTNLSNLDIELIDLILKNLTPLESKVVRATCKAWNALITANFEQLYLQKALYGKWDLPNHLCVILINIAKNTTPYSQILQICNQAAELAQMEPYLNQAVRMQASAQIIFGISNEMQQGFSKSRLADITVPDHIKQLAKTHPFASFMSGLVAYSKDKDKQELQDASDNGVPAATFLLHLYQGTEEPALLLKAVEQGSSAACLVLSERSENQDESKRLEYLHLAAELGDKSAQYLLAQECLKENEADAIKWLEKASLRGLAPAQILLGELLEAGSSKAEASYAKLQEEGISTIHVENGRFFQKHKEFITAEEKHRIDEYKLITPLPPSNEFLDEIKTIKEAILKRYQDRLAS